MDEIARSITQVGFDELPMTVTHARARPRATDASPSSVRQDAGGPSVRGRADDRDPRQSVWGLPRRDHMGVRVVNGRLALLALLLSGCRSSGSAVIPEARADESSSTTNPPRAVFTTIAPWGRRLMVLAFKK